MLTVIVEHHVKPGLMESARSRIDTNSDAMADCDGLYARLTSVSPERPDWVTTVTIWRDRSALAAWNRRKSQLSLPEAAGLYLQVRKAELEGCIANTWKPLPG